MTWLIKLKMNKKKTEIRVLLKNVLFTIDNDQIEQTFWLK